MTVAPLIDTRMSSKMPKLCQVIPRLISKQRNEEEKYCEKVSFPGNKKNVNNEATKYKFHIHTL